MQLAARIVGVLIGLFALGWLFITWFSIGLGVDSSKKETAWVLLVLLLPALVGTVAAGLGRAWGAALIAGTFIAAWVWAAVLSWTSTGGLGSIDSYLVAGSVPALLAALVAVGIAVVLSRR